MKKVLIRSVSSVVIYLSVCLFVITASADMIIDHNCTDLTQVPLSAIERAKTDLHVVYGHTSHGSQLTTGMSDLVRFVNNGGLYLPYPENTLLFNNGGTNGALDFHDGFVSGDLGNPDRTTWASRTRTYLDNNLDVNVVMWSWCGQANTTEANIDLYLSTMTQLEVDYPNVTFVYMTGHAVGTGETGNLHLRNQQIRNYCIQTDKVLFDFYDIECYDPDGTYFGDKNVNDDCSYTGGNWATEWQNSHTEGIDWFSCISAHSQPLNANQKAYATWWMLAKIAGWDNETIYPLNITIEGEGSIQVTPANEEFVTGTEVELLADPIEGWGFTNWTGDVMSSDNPLIVIIDSPKNVTALFTVIEELPIEVVIGCDATIAWDVTTPIEGSTISYNVYIANAVTDPNKVNPVKVASTIDTTYEVTLNTEGEFLVGITAVENIDGDVIYETAASWSDELPNGEKFLLKCNHLPPAMPTGLKIIQVH